MKKLNLHFLIIGLILMFSCNKNIFENQPKYKIKINKISTNYNLIYYHSDGEPYDLLIIEIFLDSNKIKWLRYEDNKIKKSGIVNHTFLIALVNNYEKSNSFKEKLDTIFNSSDQDVLDGIEIGCRVITSNSIINYFKFVDQRDFFLRFEHEYLFSIFKNILIENNVVFD
jgi:hypothetical protein